MIKLNKHRRNRISYYSLEALRGPEIISEKATDLQDSIHFTPTLSVYLIPFMETILAEKTADCGHVQNKPF